MEEQYELELEKKKMEIEYPFEENDLYWSIDVDGDLCQDQWNCSGFDKNCCKLGNAFKTEQEAEKERDKRILLTKFRQFRDKCNGYGIPDGYESKYHIIFVPQRNALEVNWYGSMMPFELFGGFKDERACKRAIELFGDEIKRLYVEEN